MVISIGNLFRCPYQFCDGVIDTVEQSTVTGGSVFVCPECDKRLFLVEGELLTDEDLDFQLEEMCTCPPG